MCRVRDASSPHAGGGSLVVGALAERVGGILAGVLLRGLRALGDRVGVDGRGFGQRVARASAA